MKNNKYQFKFSVIIPVYNVEIYIEETIKSILEQTLGFKENIQIILVNDGSPDNSEKICLKYKDKYPENIVYIKQENSGVSAARNLGMKYVKGKYVNFLDSDDKWDKNSLKRIWGFFEKNYRNIDVVDCRVKYFDGMHGYHIFDKRYHKTRIVNLKKEYDFTFLNSPTAVFKAEAIKGMEFDNRLKFSEDTKFINQVLLKKLKCGICKEAKYLYRKRQDDTSAVDSRLNRKDYYIGPLQHCFKELIDSAKKQYGSVPLYIQNLVLSNIIWRSTLTDTVDVLTKTELDDYKKIIRQLLRQIDDEIIINKKSNLYIKMYVNCSCNQ